MKIAGKDRCINCMKPLDKSGVCLHCSFDESSYVTDQSELKPGTCLNERYFIGRVLGQGGFGITYVAYDIVLALRVAIKEYYPVGEVSRNISDDYTEVTVHSRRNASNYDDGLRAFLLEARIMSKFIELPGIVKVRDFFQENNTAYLVMEYVNGTRISSYIEKNGPFSANDVLKMMEPVISSMASIHETGYLHKDISANNIMITADKKLVLIDFGTARTIEQSDMTMTVAVKRGFSPEEQYRRKGKLGPWSDIYSLCATMYYMITGIIPSESVERVITDSVTPLVRMRDIDIDPGIAKAIDKGMAVMACDRYQNVRELYTDLYPDNTLPDIIQFDIANDDIESSEGNIIRKKESNNTVVSRTTLRNELDILFAKEKGYHRLRTIRNVAIIIVLLIVSFAVMKRVINTEADNEADKVDMVTSVELDESNISTIGSSEMTENSNIRDNSDVSDDSDKMNNSENDHQDAGGNTTDNSETNENVNVSKETKNSEDTQAPETTQTSKPTKEQKSTTKPEVTKKPGTTKKPDSTRKPTSTKKPAYTKKPEPTKKPNPTKKPTPTKKPQKVEDNNINDDDYIGMLD